MEQSQLHRRVEEAAMNALPAFQQLLLDGWILRFSQGYTKRANSVNPLYQSHMHTLEKVRLCERLYREQRLPPIFRLTSFAGLGQLDQLLQQRGYTIIDQSYVMHAGLAAVQPPATNITSLHIESLADWMEVFNAFHFSPTAHQEKHRALLEQILTGRTCFTLYTGNTAVACGLGVLEGSYFGLFDIITAPEFRRRGYGNTLVNGMLEWAYVHGAQHAYLQVAASNNPAIHLYTKIGFLKLHAYWYRMPE